VSTLLTRIQEVVKHSGVDAWVFYDFRGSNDLAWQMLEVPPDAHCTRRWMVVVPAQGFSTKVIHRMEQTPLSHLKATQRVYDTHQSWVEAVTESLKEFATIAMEYSPMNAIPVASKVDAGTIEFIRSLGINVVTSADISQQFTAVLSEEQIAGAAITAGYLRAIIMDAFEFIRESILNKTPVHEYLVQQRIVEQFRSRGLVSDSSPIVAIGPRAASPHYAPSFSESATIEKDMVVLIDAWCKSEAPGSVYADLTWVGYTAREVPPDIESAFSIIVHGRNAAIEFVSQRFQDAKPVFGFEVDDACRSVINASGMGSAFIHRTGHNITTEIHGPGANMDNFETHDTRQILKSTSFSIEPGLYIPETLGLRTEIDIAVLSDGTVTIPSAPIQTAILPLLGDEWQQ